MKHGQRRLVGVAVVCGLLVVLAVAVVVGVGVGVRKLRQSDPVPAKSGEVWEGVVAHPFRLGCMDGDAEILRIEVEGRVWYSADEVLDPKRDHVGRLHVVTTGGPESPRTATADFDTEGRNAPFVLNYRSC